MKMLLNSITLSDVVKSSVMDYDILLERVKDVVIFFTRLLLVRHPSLGFMNVMEAAKERS
jgi:hypothetical protein